MAKALSIHQDSSSDHDGHLPSRPRELEQKRKSLFMVAVILSFGTAIAFWLMRQGPGSVSQQNPPQVPEVGSQQSQLPATGVSQRGEPAPPPREPLSSGDLL